ncbi:MAG: ankyrin repeat domain-containing protein [Candidatus Dependentiae bacterium]|nr:ankyrin repeat domain-containing protein [Candidatus Dependentiae bacterium]
MKLSKILTVFIMMQVYAITIFAAQKSTVSTVTDAGQLVTKKSEQTVLSKKLDELKTAIDKKDMEAVAKLVPEVEKIKQETIVDKRVKDALAKTRADLVSAAKKLLQDNKHQRPDNQHNVAIWLDKSESGKGLMTYIVAFAFCDARYPMILSNFLLHSFFTSEIDEVKRVQQAVLDSFKENGWSVYKNKSEDFYLFIPKSYLTDKQLQEDPKKSGFNIKDLIKISDPMDFKNIKIGSDRTAPINLDNLFALFIQSKDESAGMWNIYLEGHGIYSRKLEAVIDSGELPTQFSSLKIADYDDASIAGLKLPAFRKMIQFLVHNINTNFLYYLTCHGGGYNALLPFASTLVTEKGNILGLGIEEPDFVIVNGSIGEDSVITSVSKKNIDLCVACSKDRDCLDKNSYSLAGLFNALNTFSYTIGVKPTIFKDEELIHILTPITIRGSFLRVREDVSNLPQVMFPKSKIFRAVNLKGVYTITNALAASRALEKKPIVIGSERVLLYARNLYELTVEGFSNASILSVLPYISLHKISTLNIEERRSIDELVGLFFGIIYKFPKYFYIDMVNFHKDSMKINNMLIRMQGFEAHVIYRTVDDKVYYDIYGADEEVKYVTKKSSKLLSKTELQESKNKQKSEIIKDQFISTVIEYFQHNEVKRFFNYDTIFSKLLSSDELVVVSQYVNPIANVELSEIASWENRLLQAASFDIKAIETLLNRQDIIKSGANLNAVDELGNTALILLARQDEKKNTIIIPLIKKMIKMGADVNLSSEDKTALKAAVLQDNAGIVQALVDAGAKVDSSTFLLAIRRGIQTIVEMLIKAGADVNVKDKDGNSPLAVAVLSNNKDIVEILIRAKADVKINNRRGQPVLSDAVTQGDKDIVGLLLGSGADANTKNKNGRSVLMQAVEKNDATLVSMLIKAGADVNAKDLQGRTAANFATTPEIKQLLESASK